MFGDGFFITCTLRTVITREQQENSGITLIRVNFTSSGLGVTNTLLEINVCSAIF